MSKSKIINKQATAIRFEKRKRSTWEIVIDRLTNIKFMIAFLGFLGTIFAGWMTFQMSRQTNVVTDAKATADTTRKEQVQIAVKDESWKIYRKFRDSISDATNKINFANQDTLKNQNREILSHYKK